MLKGHTGKIDPEWPTPDHSLLKLWIFKLKIPLTPTEILYKRKKKIFSSYNNNTCIRKQSGNI